eukprot:m.36050 g.36050  ORF g.36050 m.36050 type:complete len:465 (-) comp5371_c0_seq1:156-1550(-)
MAVAAIPKLVCWATRQEWLDVRAWFFADDSAQHRACDRVKAWGARGKLPLGVESTFNLIHARLLDSSGKVDEHTLRMVYSMAFVRFVNGFSDAEQKGTHARSVQSISASLNIQERLVDLRHDATHGALPSLPLLRNSLSHALAWLKEYYWDRQVDELERQTELIRDKLRLYAALAGPSRGKRAALDDDAETDPEEVLKTIVANVAPNSVREVLLAEMLQAGVMVSAPVPDCAESSQEEWIELWTPLLRHFDAAWPQFSSAYLHTVLGLLKAAAAADSTSQTEWESEQGLAWLGFMFSAGLALPSVDAAVCVPLLHACLAEPDSATHCLVPLLLSKHPLSDTVHAQVDALMHAAQLSHDGVDALPDLSLEDIERNTDEFLRKRAVPHATGRWRPCMDPRWQTISIGGAPPRCVAEQHIPHVAEPTAPEIDAPMPESLDTDASAVRMEDSPASPLLPKPVLAIEVL